MIAPKIVCVHGLSQARHVLTRAAALGVAVQLISGRNAAMYGGCLWWRAMMAAAGTDGPGWDGILDCGAAAGQAMAALRSGQATIVLEAATPGFSAVLGAAGGCGATVLGARPACFDMGHRAAMHGLGAWLAA